MQLEQRVDVLEDKVTQLQIETAKISASNAHTAKNLEKMSDILAAEHQMLKIVFTFLGKYYPHILTILGGIGSVCYYAGVHRLII